MYPGYLFQVADMIRHVLDSYTQAIPAVLEIPSKEHPYDASKDSILRRAKVSVCFGILHVFERNIVLVSVSARFILVAFVSLDDRRLPRLGN